MITRRILLATIALFAALLFIELPGTALFEPDEARYAEIPREMLAAHDLVTPRLNGSKYYEKPPLLYWANAASFALLGETPFAARLPARLAALGTATLLAWALGGEWGLWAALMLLSAPLSYVLGRYNIIDGVLTFAMTITLVALRRFFRRRERGEPAGGALAVIGISAALSVLAKGLIGIVLPGLAVVLVIALLGEWRRLSELLFSRATVLLVVIAAPWFILMERANPGFSQFFFVREHLQRFATDEAKRAGPVYYFVLVFIAGFLPWTVAFGAWLRGAGVRTRAALRERRDELLFAAWIAVIVLFFSFSRSKLLPYILPAMPAAAALAARPLLGAPLRARAAMMVYAAIATAPLAVLLVARPARAALAPYHALPILLAGAVLLAAGAWIAVRLARRDLRAASVAAALGWGGLYLAAALSLPRLAPLFSTTELARHAAAGWPHATVVAYGSYPQGLAWTLRHPVPVVDYVGELASDGERSPAFFWSRDDLHRRWGSREPVVVILKPRDLSKWLSKADTLPCGASVLSGAYLLVSNVSPVPAPCGPR